MKKLLARIICWLCRPAIEAALAEADRRRHAQIERFEKTGSFNPRFVLRLTEADTEIDKLGFIYCLRDTVKENLRRRIDRERKYHEANEAGRLRRILDENKPAERSRVARKRKGS